MREPTPPSQSLPQNRWKNGTGLHPWSMCGSRGIYFSQTVIETSFSQNLHPGHVAGGGIVRANQLTSFPEVAATTRSPGKQDGTVFRTLGFTPLFGITFSSSCYKASVQFHWGSMGSFSLSSALCPPHPPLFLYSILLLPASVHRLVFPFFRQSRTARPHFLAFGSSHRSPRKDVPAFGVAVASVAVPTFDLTPPWRQELTPSSHGA